MKTYLIYFCALVFAIGVQAQQRSITKTGSVTLDASTPLEDIHAENNGVNAILTAEGELAVLLLIEDFEFPNKLMQEHFNENYLESHKYPKATFRGHIEEFSSATLGSQEVTLSGDLNIHGVTRPVRVTATLESQEKGAQLNASFKVRTADYNIKIPRLLFKKIAEEVTLKLRIAFTANP